MHENGLGFMKEAIGLEVVERLLQIAEARILEVEAKIRTGHPNIRLGVDLFALQEVASRGIHRYDVLFDEEDPQSSLIFELSRTTAPWVKYIQKILGTSELHILASVVYSDPGSEDQEWHSDGPHQGKDSYAVCVFLPLIDLDATVGFTQFYPRSHRHQALLGMGGASLATGSALDAIFNRGDAILYDYRTIHRGIGNRSIGTRRPLLQLVYHTNSYKESRNYGKEELLL
jgi:ectoine hydroxylase-related dioxygenase (phytanoyl-CoA dioxygenase family)